MDIGKCDKCKNKPKGPLVDMPLVFSTAACRLCAKVYTRCQNCGGVAGAERSLTAHAGLNHPGRNAGPRQAEGGLHTFALTARDGTEIWIEEFGSPAGQKFFVMVNGAQRGEYATEKAALHATVTYADQHGGV